jgi:hypothetical protein
MEELNTKLDSNGIPATAVATAAVSTKCFTGFIVKWRRDPFIYNYLNIWHVESRIDGLHAHHTFNK